MALFRSVLVLLFFLGPFASEGQTVTLIGTSEEFILDNVKGYPSVQVRGMEHEEFDVLVFEDKDRELSFHFSFYKGEKVCSFIRCGAPLAALKDEIAFIKANLLQVRENIWENSGKTVQAVITAKDDIGIILIKAMK